MATTLYLYESLQRLLEYAEMDANFKNLRTTADAAATKAGTALTSGATLGNTAQAGATVLDWYEEGTFTPVLFGTTTAGVGTYTIQAGFYTRIGREVHFKITASWTAHTGSGLIRISGLPFTSSNVLYNYAALSVRYGSLLVGSGKQLAAYVAPGTSVIILSLCDPGGAGVDEVAVDTSASLMLSGSYFV